MLSEVEHRDVAVRVPGGQERSAAGAAPDPDRLLRPIIEIVCLRLMRDRATMLVARVLEGGRAADHTVTRDAIDLLADRPHEVTTAARREVVRKPIGLQVAEQLDHWHVRRVEIPTTERRMLRRTQE